MLTRFATLLALISLPFTIHASTEEEVMAEGSHPGLKVEANVAFTEGPAWHAPSKSMFFTDVLNNRIMRRDASGAVQVYRSPSMHANGLAFDNEDRLIVKEKRKRPVEQANSHEEQHEVVNLRREGCGWLHQLWPVYQHVRYERRLCG